MVLGQGKWEGHKDDFLISALIRRGQDRCSCVCVCVCNVCVLQQLLGLAQTEKGFMFAQGLSMCVIPHMLLVTERRSPPGPRY